MLPDLACVGNILPGVVPRLACLLCTGYVFIPSKLVSKVNGCVESLKDRGIHFVESSSLGMSSLLFDDVAALP